MGEPFANLIDRIETQLKVTDAPGMDVRFTMNRDAAAAYVEQLRVTSKLLASHEQLQAILQELLDRSEAIAQWHQHWDLPFAEEDEWSGDAQLWRDARVKAAAALTGKP